MRKLIKIVLHITAMAILALPALVAVIGWRLGHSEGLFQFFAQSLSVIPGKFGEFLRRAYYKITLRNTGKNLVVGYGSFFTHMECVLGDSVWIGQYTIVGRADFGDNVLVSDHVSILSGRYHHTHQSSKLVSKGDGTERISIGSSTWIGANSVVMADVGAESIVGAGSIVVHPVSKKIVVCGNPAIAVKNRDE